MRNGIGSFYLKLTYKKMDLSDYVVDFSYSHSEEDDDTCNISLKLSDIKILDSGAFRKNLQWEATWGYLEDPLNWKKEKIYLEEITPTFDDEIINVSIVAHDKVARLKKVKGNGVIKNASLPSYLSDRGKPLGITTVLDMPYKPVPFTTDTKLSAKDQAYLKRAQSTTVDNRRIIAETAKRDLKTNEFQNARKNAQVVVYPGIYRDYSRRETPQFVAAVKQVARQAIENGEDPRVLEKKLYLLDKQGYFEKSFSNQPNMAEAGRSNKQVVDALASKDPNGPYVVTGHGNVAYIRKRNLDKSPIYAYEYGAEPGELISFKPSTKNKAKQSSATSVGYSGWDPLNKTAFSGKVADGTNPQVPVGIGGGVANNPNPNDNPNSSMGSFAFGQANSQTFSTTRDFRNRAMAVRDNTAAPIKSITLSPTTATQPQPESGMGIPPSKNILSSTHNPVVAQAEAANLQANDSLEQNPGSLVVVGNPKLKDGEVVQITGVSKSYSGNYYITKVTDKWSSGSAYQTECEILRNTVGLIPNISASESIPSGTIKINKSEPEVKPVKTKSPTIKAD